MLLLLHPIRSDVSAKSITNATGIGLWHTICVHYIAVCIIILLSLWYGPRLVFVQWAASGRRPRLLPLLPTVLVWRERPGFSIGRECVKHVGVNIILLTMIGDSISLNVDDQLIVIRIDSNQNRLPKSSSYASYTITDSYLELSVSKAVPLATILANCAC